MKKTSLKTLLLALTALWLMPATGQQALPQLGKSPLQEVISAMTLEEKVNLVVGGGMFVPGMQLPGASSSASEAQKRVLGAAGTTYAIPRLGIPGIVVCDGPAGVHAFNAGKSRVYYATAWPIGTLLASSWDTALVRQIGAVYGAEAKEFGIDVILGPGMNIHRNPLGARNFEYYSEDPLLTGHMAAAAIRGIQQNGVGTSAKHFFANNQETNRNSVNTTISERAIREIYLRGWQIAVQRSDPWTIMSSYNLVNGPYTSENPELLQQLLRGEWGYMGLVMTDWFGGKDAVAQQLAGNDLLMPGTPPQKKAILDAVKSGKLQEKVLDENIYRILSLVLKTSSFAKYTYSDNPPLSQHARISRQAAAESMVLLKNEQQALPIRPGSSVALFGNGSMELVAGGTGSGDVNKMYTVSLAEGMFQAGFSLNTELYRAYASYLESETAKRPKKSFFEEMMQPQLPIPQMELTDSDIRKAAEQSSIAIIALSRNAGEGRDRVLRDDYLLTDAERSLVRRVSEAFHARQKKVVATLNIGGVIHMADWQQQVDAILLAWHPGLEGGNAMADLLSGKINPSGKLATTFPARYDDDVSARNFPGREIPGTEKPGLMGMKTVDAEVVYEEGVYVGYRYYQTFGVKPAYPFGYGLSYTTFGFSHLVVSSPDATGNVQVDLTVTNTGVTAGKEVVQLYLSAPTGKIDKPSSELKGFAKTQLLQPGASQDLRFSLTPGDMASFQTTQNAWIADAGKYTVHFGHAGLWQVSGSFTLQKAIVVEKVGKLLVPKVVIPELKSPPTKK